MTKKFIVLMCLTLDVITTTSISLLSTGRAVRALKNINVRAIDKESQTNFATRTLSADVPGSGK